MAGALLVVSPALSGAHEIPASVIATAIVRPQGQRLFMAVRVPLEALRDIDFPTRGAGYLDLARATPLLAQGAKLWIADYIELYENGERLSGASIVATQLSLPSDRSFASYDGAVAHIRGTPLDERVELPWKQAMLDVLLEYPITSDQSPFSIRPALAHLGVRTTTVLRFAPPGGAERAFEYVGDPGVVHLDPRWFQAAWAFVRHGFAHILDGIDHLLFLLCLVIPVRRLRPLVGIVTAFTVAHSITLVASATGLAPRALWFPPLIEALIALSIGYMALGNIVGPKLERRWVVAFGFGLVHGFGFSFALRESLQFAGSHLAASLFAFNVGVELGQLLVIAVSVPVIQWLFRRVVAERMGTTILSAIIAHTAWHWTAERVTALREYRFEWPAFDLALASAALSWALLLAIVGAALWMLSELLARLQGTARGTESPARAEG